MEGAKDLAIAAAIGAVAGLRSMMAPAVVSWAASDGRLEVDGPVHWFSSPIAARVLAGLAATELVVDKLPFAPDRTMPASLVLRIVSGALCGAAVCSSERGRMRAGAILGCAAAVAGAFAGLQLRRTGAKKGWPAIPVAFAEDAMAAGAAIAVTTATD